MYHYRNDEIGEVNDTTDFFFLPHHGHNGENLHTVVTKYDNQGFLLQLHSLKGNKLWSVLIVLVYHPNISSHLIYPLIHW